MAQRFGTAIVGMGPTAKPHLQSLYDLQGRITLRHAVTRLPSLAEMGPFADQVEPHSDLQNALNNPLVRPKPKKLRVRPSLKFEWVVDRERLYLQAIL
jgi:hypothetical protein